MELKLVKAPEEATRTCKKCSRDLPMGSFQHVGPGYLYECKDCWTDPRIQKEFLCRRCKTKQPYANFEQQEPGRPHRRRICKTCEPRTAGLITRLTNETERTCKVCHVTQPILFFVKNRDSEKRISLLRTCADCRRKDFSQRAKKYRCVTSLRSDPAKRLYAAIKSRARMKGIPFNLTIDDLFIPEYCPVLGIKLDRNPGHVYFPDAGMSVDRLVPELGYVRGNILVMSGRANRLKSNGTAAEHERLAAWMRSQGLP